MFPTNGSFDGYQRWAGREHLLVQDWLPATQFFIFGTASLGGDVMATRVVLSVVAALATACGAWLAQHLGGRWAGWLFLGPGLFSAFVFWESQLYQEGTFLAVFLGGLALAASGRLLAADLVLGALALVRYEGWPCVALYLLWRRDVRALRALWGAAAWLAVRSLYGHGYEASPVDFADWNGLTERFRLEAWKADLARLGKMVVQSGGLWWMSLGVVGLVVTRRSGLAWVLAGAAAVQSALVVAWVAGIEGAFSRMLILPVVLSGVLAAAALGRAAGRWPFVAGPLALVLLAGQLAVSASDVGRRGRMERMNIVPELKAAGEIAKCAGCTWWVVPRRKLGTRARHDGCEVLQGLGPLDHGRQFWCGPWVPEAERAEKRAACDGTIVWTGGRYRVERKAPPPEEAEPEEEASGSEPAAEWG
jgi:hypothetical protein